jgi:PAS domain S-box-containing protein
MKPVSLQTILDALPAPVFYKDAEGRYLGCNTAFEVLLGRSKEQILGLTACDIAPEPLAEVQHHKDQELLRNPGIQVYEVALRHADGTSRQMRYNQRTFLDETDVISGIAGLIQDISEQNRSEAHLAETLELVRKMVAVVPSGITMFEAGSGQCILCNPAMTAIMGSSPEEIRKQNFRAGSLRRPSEPWRLTKISGWKPA